MLNKKLFLPLAAIALVGAVAACEKVAPATPEPTPGPMAQSNALNGVYNLRASDCGVADSKTGLTIDGNRFVFPAASCRVANSETQVNRTEVTLACDGSGTGGNRVVQLQSRPGVLRVTEDHTTLTYFQCAKAAASSDTMPVLSQPRNDL
ncbi:hypothetical protein [Paracoccus sp. (in: a-proteobacteria)]|uniref:hypothetical protein n=1 Tax=Paracoccus sp. TaxID=267 RepID=UPI00289F4D8D|nr:hypothetical protein [Paracoccus sp. (in: a-proteobacteria)]